LTGEVIIPLKYQAIGWHDYFPYYITAQLDDRWGVIKVEGEVVLPFEYAGIQVWADYGVATVRSEDRNYTGMVELYTGREIVPFGRYHHIAFDEGGIAQVTRRYGSTPNHRNARGFINITTGEEIVPLIYDNTNAFAEGLAAVQADGLWGFIDTSGEVVIPHIYDTIRSTFINGTIAVSRDGLWGIIDTAGAYILPPTHDWINWPVNGFAAFSTIDPISQNSYTGILYMQTGEAIVPAIYQGFFFAGEGIVLMRYGDWLCHDNNVLINLETGRQFAFPYAIGDDIEYCGPTPPTFVNGISVVHVRNPEGHRIYGIADNEGREILPAIYHIIDWLPGGLFAARKGPSQWGIVDGGRQVVLPLIYCEIERALGGRDPDHDISAIRVGGEWAQVSQLPNPEFRLEGALWGFVDIKGQMVVPPVLELLEAQTMGHSAAAVRMPDGLWGLIRIHAEGL